jgi:uncharacterized membrane protein
MFEINNWVHSTIGAIHFASSLIGLITGAFILLTQKGTKLHKQIGYTFAVALVIVNISALFIYDFNEGQISLFHFLIPVSLFFLLYGLRPMMWVRKGKAKYLNRHIIGMNGAALGLWAAGATEFFVRELASGLTKGELILYSFLISVPFAILITVSITINLRRSKSLH